MSWGWECKSKFIKQVTPKLKEKPPRIESGSPGPQDYDPPRIFGGTSAISHIKSAPAYTFGIRTRTELAKSSITARATLPNTRNMTKKGPERVTHGCITPCTPGPEVKQRIPGPGTYHPRDVTARRPPAYSLAPAARPNKNREDTWVPSPNMYWPTMVTHKKKEPAYSLAGGDMKYVKPSPTPGPGQYDPNYKYMTRKLPEYSFTSRCKTNEPVITPSPNHYCYKKFNYTKPTSRAYSFGIRHSKYVGEQTTYLKSSNEEGVHTKLLK